MKMQILHSWKFLRVLIDTWWNVNTNKLGAGVEEIAVLIDTWWNVNEVYGG